MKSTIGYALMIAALLGAAPSGVHAQGLPCDQLMRDAVDLRVHLDQTNDPFEHARLSARLQKVHDQEDRCAP